MAMLDLNWLKTFVTLAQCQHFGRTATLLHMTQPNVSLHIKQLERATNIKLVERSPFRLTQAGLRLLESSERTLQELKVCQADLNAFNELSSGTLTIAVSDIVSRALLIHPLQRFKAEYPGISVTLLNTTSAQASELVKNAEADLGFVMSQKQSQPLHFTELQTISWCALGNDFDLAANQHPEHEYNEGHQSNGNKLTLILLGHDTRTRELIDQGLPLLNLAHYSVMEVGSVDAQIDWAEAGFGVAIIPEFAILTKPSLKSNITPLPNFAATSFGYVVRQNQVLSKAMKRLLQWVEDEIEGAQQP
jgi:DNA-binding transcriptional LysR family regulator